MEDTVRGNGLLWALAFNEEGRATVGDDIAGPGAAWTWGHFNLADIRARTFLKRLNAPAAVVERLGDDDERLVLRHEAGWTFGVLPDLERDLGGGVTGPGRLRFAFDQRQLITARHHALKIVDEVRRMARDGERLASPAEALIGLIEHYAEVLEDRLDVLGRDIDDIEDRVLGGGGNLTAAALGPLRRELAAIRRDFAGLRGALYRAGAARGEGRKTASVHPLAERLVGLASLIDDVDREAAGLQDRGRLLHEELDTLINSATNRTMRALTVISTLLIPPTLIVGAFGMNVEGIPFSHSGLGFALAIAICVAVVAAAFQLLRRGGLLP